MGTLHRAQILLESEQHRALTDIAQREGRSLSDLVREIVADYLDLQKRETRLYQDLEAIRALSHIREQIQAQYGTLSVDLVADVRAERDRDTEQVWEEQG